jgi:restriction system protein
MSIWEYKANEPYRLLEAEANLFQENFWLGHNKATKQLGCRYCQTGLRVLGSQELPPNINGGGWGEKTLHTCPACGWWVVIYTWGYARGSYEGSINLRRAAGLLRELDLSNIDTPIDNLKRYLIARYDKRFIINPRRFEDIVAGVFSDFGYRVRITSYSGDKGVDVVILDGDYNDTVGVQVKRWMGKIEAEQIRSLAGALVLNKMTKGIFVTTSSFTSGAFETVEEYRQRGLGILLWDADAFYDKLRISQRSLYDCPDDEAAPYFALWNDHESIPSVFSRSW